MNPYRYDPWGNSIGTTGTAYNEYRYAGTYREPDLGLYQMGARFYMPAAGRFTQQDPLPSSVFEDTPIYSLTESGSGFKTRIRNFTDARGVPRT